MKHGFFVTGTDTGVGKTLISSALVHHYALKGYRSAGMKPVAAGCIQAEGRWLSEDVAMLCAASNVELPLAIVNPYAFEPPIAPHVAAEMAGTVIEMPILLDVYRKAKELTDVLIVEGVGGFRVPLNDRQDTADLTVQLGLPVILVVGMRLGCLNHALLTMECIFARGLRVAGWVANTIDPHMPAFKENLDALEKRISAPCLGVVSYEKKPTPDKVELALRQQLLGDFNCL